MSLPRITHVITGTNLGGAERMLFRLISSLREDWECDVVSLLPLGEIGTQMIEAGIPTRSLNASSLLELVAARKRLCAHLSERQSDIVQSWMYHADLVTSLSLPRNKPPHHVWNIRGATPAHGEKLRTKAVISACAALSHLRTGAIVTCAHSAVDAHVKFGYRRSSFHVIPNFIDDSIFRPNLESRQKIRDELKIAKEYSIVSLIGRHHPQKNHAGFLKAAEKIYQTNPHVIFLMCGPNVTIENLRNIVPSALPIGSIRLLGPRSDINKILAASDVLASASTFGEGFPNSVLEGMACGVPCVVTDIGDSAYVVGEGGLVVPPNKDTALAAAIQKALQKPELGSAGRSRVLANFTRAQVVPQYDALYRQLLEKQEE